MERRVVVTGMGTVNPLGHNVADSWTRIKNCENGICKIDTFDVSEYPCKVAGIVKDLDTKDYLDRKDSGRLDRFSVFAMISSIQAMQDAGIKDGDVNPERLGVIIGNGIGGLGPLEKAFYALFNRGPNRVYPLTIPQMISNIAPGNVAIRFNAQGPCYAVVTACSSGTDAIANAMAWIKNGAADIMIAGGTESPVVPISLAGFCVIKAVTRNFNDRPEKASRPFDRDRDGFIIAEGAGIMVIEELEHAKKRGARIYAELAGYGLSCDANHLTAPHPEGRGAIQAMRMALRVAGLKPEDIDYINAHGTSTPLNDPTETKAIKAVFGEHAKKLKVSSVKSMLGHMIAGAGAFEAVVSVLAIKDQFFPPTRNYENPDPECDLDYVPNKGYAGRIRAVLSDSLGFGGHNGVLIFKEYKE